MGDDKPGLFARESSGYSSEQSRSRVLGKVEASSGSKARSGWLSVEWKIGAAEGRSDFVASKEE